jgi:hypothetical protein
MERGGLRGLPPNLFKVGERFQYLSMLSANDVSSVFDDLLCPRQP